MAEAKKSLAKDVANLYQKTALEKSPPIRVSLLSKYAEKMWNKGINGLDEIKTYLSDVLKTITNSKEQQIIQSILECKVAGERIILRDNTFNRKLSLYICDNDVKTKCLTNDYLYMYMTCKNVIEKTGVTQVLKNFLPYCTLDTVTVTSENFSADVETYKGLIQDYESDFSVICTSKDINNVIIPNITSKPNAGSFVMNGDTFNYFGDTDSCVIYRDGLTDDQIATRIGKVKFIRSTKGVFADGERVMKPDGKLKFLDKTVTTESFCPAFWISEKEIQCSMLFKMDMVYNILFDFLEQTSTDRHLNTIGNMFYWDTLTVGMDFLNVYALTSQKINNEVKRGILRWCDTFNSLRGYIKAWRDNQLRIQRLFFDFIWCFNNNSDYARFYNVYTKAERCSRVLSTLRKDKNFAEMNELFAEFTFIDMIKNQLKTEVFALVEKVKMVLRKYINGEKPDSIYNDVVTVGKQIQSLLPTSGIDKAAFPFIVAEGGLLGNDVDLGNFSFNPVYKNLMKNNKRATRKKQQESSRIKEVAALVSTTERNIRNFVYAYVENGSKKRGILNKILPKDLATFTNMFMINLQKDDPDYEELVKAVLEWNKDKKKYKFKKIDIIERKIEEFKSGDIVASDVTRRRAAKATPKPPISTRRTSARLMGRKTRRSRSEDVNDRERLSEEEENEEDE